MHNVVVREKLATHTWLGGEGFSGAIGVLEGGAMVMTNFHVELGIAKCLIYTIFYAFELVPVSENGGTNSNA
jgi:hypothetical protein